jgi:hypothetical protein
MSKRINLVGRRFGKLVVLRLAEISFDWRTSWWVRCDCGKEKKVIGASLRRGATRTCGCRLIDWNHGNRIRPYEALYHLLVRAAHSRSHEIILSYEDFVEFAQQTECHYCGAAVSFAEFSPRSATYNLDRKDNSLGYSKENCVVCCWRCNGAKGDRYTYWEWKVMTQALKENL